MFCISFAGRTLHHDGDVCAFSLLRAQQYPVQYLHLWHITIWSSSLLSKNLKNEIYRIIIFSLVLYGCENWSLTLREERRLRVFENGGAEENIWV